MIFRAAMSIIVALIMGVCILGGVQTPPAAAFEPAPWFNPATPKEVKVFKEVVRLTREGGTQQQNTARKILSRQAMRSSPRLAAGVIGIAGTTGGLLMAAAGAWTIVGLEIYYLPCWECGHETISISGEVKPSDGAFAARAPGGTSPNSLRQGFITAVHGERTTSGNTKIELYGIQRVVRWFRYNNTSCAAPNYLWSSPAVGMSISSSATVTYGEPPVWPDINSGCVPVPPVVPSIGRRTATVAGTTSAVSVLISGDVYGDGSGSVVTKSHVVCPLNGSCSPLRFPAWDAGSWSLGDTGASPARSGPQDGTDYINNVVADPETAPLVDPMDVPEPWIDPDHDWDNDPFNPLFDPFADPEGDPDGDGIPNREDPDPEGDEDPDGDGNPNEHPPLAPWPETDDPEGDGDPDGDGDPNETNPYTPQPNPYDPATDPDGDPDDDGIPNEDDPDPAVPTDPGTLPDDHPYADPDEDGQPNKDDPDDDNDGIPDGDDPNPTTPDAPEELPEWHPFADPDQDGTPNRTDRDDDGDDQDDWKDREPWAPMPLDDPGRDDDDEDGIPNRDDPWPGNPLAPHDPDLDQDEDDVPDFEDPMPNDPLVPHAPTGPTEDGSSWRYPPEYPTPTWDPDTPPWRPGNPGDPNVPRSPNNPTVPTTQQTPQNPPDYSVPGAPGIPTRPDVPDDPTTPESPDDPRAPTGGLCPKVEPPEFDLPEIDVMGKFPFSLMLWTVGTLDVLAAGATTPPCLTIPLLQAEWCFDEIDGIVGMLRNLLWFFGAVAQMVGFYILIKGGRGTE